VKLRLNLTLVLAVAALGLVIYQMIQRHLSPWYLIILVALFAGRFYVRRQVRTREQILKEVPRHPLGLSEDD
jgi:FtsH-binding integral membrane protein